MSGGGKTRSRQGRSPDPDELLTVAEIAALLKLNQQTIRNWIDAGRLPRVRLGARRVRVYRRDLDRLLADSETAEVAAVPPPLSIWDGVIPDPVLP